MDAWSPVALSSMHYRHVELGAVMVEKDGWQRPSRYMRAGDEVDRLREGVGIFDVSPAGKLRLHGEELDSYVGAVLDETEPVARGRVGVHKLSKGLGGRDVVEARLADDETLLITPPNQARTVLELLRAVSGRCAHAVNVTSGLAGVSITGPLAPRLLAAVTELNASPEGFPNMSCAQGKIAEIHGTLIRRDVGGLLSYDLYFGHEFGEYIWGTLMEAGQEYGVVPFGLEAAALLG